MIISENLISVIILRSYLSAAATAIRLTAVVAVPILARNTCLTQDLLTLALCQG